MPRRSVAACCFVAAAVTVAFLPLARAAEPPLALGEVYRLIKAQEARIPLPEPAGTAVVGTYDAASATFAGLLSSVEVIEVNGKPRRITIVPGVPVDGVNARLVFRFVHNDSRTVVLHVGRRLAVVTPPKDSVTIDVGRARSVQWSIQSGTKRIESALNIRRPRIVGVGAFTVDALPVALLYEPPQPADAARRNSAGYAQTSLLGTRITTSFTNESGTTTFGSTPGFETYNAVRNGMGSLGDLLGKASDPKLKLAGGVLKTVSSLMGRADRTIDEVTAEARENTLEIQLAETSTCETAARAGPGEGDLIMFVQNARVVWMDDGTRTTLAFLGADAAGCKSVRTLKAALPRLRPVGPATPARLCLPKLARCARGLSASTIEALLALDPFVANGPRTTLAADRFEPRESIISDADAIVTRTRSASVGTDDTRAHARSTVTTDDIGKSLFTFLGIGPSETKRVRTTVTTESSTSFRDGKTVTTSVRIEGPPPGTDTIDVFYDRLFGTFALR